MQISSSSETIFKSISLPKPVDSYPTTLSQVCEDMIKKMGSYLSEFSHLHSDARSLSHRCFYLSECCNQIEKWDQSLFREGTKQSIDTAVFKIFSQAQFTDAVNKGIALQNLTIQLAKKFSKLGKELERVEEGDEFDYRLQWRLHNVEFYLERIESKLSDSQEIKEIISEIRSYLEGIREERLSNASSYLIQPASCNSDVSPSLKPIPPVPATLPQDPLWQHNMSVLANHPCSELMLDGSGYLRLDDRISTQIFHFLSDTVRKIISFVGRLFRFSGENHVSDPCTHSSDYDRESYLYSRVSLLKSGRSGDKIRECAVETLKQTAQFIRDGKVTSVVSHHDLEPDTFGLPKEFIKSLEIMYLNGVTPYTYSDLLAVCEIDLDKLDLPEDLHGFFKSFKSEIKNLKKYAEDLKLIEKWYSILIKNSSVKSVIPEGEGLNQKNWHKLCESITDWNGESCDNNNFNELGKQALLALDSLIKPWKGIDKKCNRVISTSYVIEHLPNPSCREITLSEFHRLLTNTIEFSRAPGFSLRKSYPQLALAIHELWT